jgi:hypothetical protein
MWPTVYSEDSGSNTQHETRCVRLGMSCGRSSRDLNGAWWRRPGEFEVGGAVAARCAGLSVAAIRVTVSTERR